ncbi:adhesin, partial [Mesorhizobium sp. B2-5-4]|uniref:beta strand repeat-containing protein n=1 Tax=Mesorhizobium sp. B2-5-4 TaxID=2589926 RepID=UPI0011288AD6
QKATGQVTFSDVDTSDTHTLSVSVAAAHGTASVDADGTWHYTVSDSGAVDALAVGEHLADSFTVQVDDHNGGVVTQVVSIDIVGTNDAPIGVNDTSASLGAVAATEKGGTLNGSGGNNGTGNVLTNDSDIDSAGLTVSGIRTGGVEGAGTAGSVGAGLVGAHGTLTLNSDGSYTYVVNENDATVQALNTGGSTTDTFNYTVSDGSLTDTAVLTVTINGANDAPIGVNDTSASLGAVAATEKGGTLNGSGGNNGTGNVLTNDSDIDSAGLTVSGIRTGGVEGAGTAGSVGAGLVGAHGTLTLNSDGSYTYVVNENDATVQALNTGGSTTDTFNYTVSDGSLTDTAVLTVTINGANDAAALSSASVNRTEGNTTAAISTSGSLTISDVDSPATFVAQGGTAGAYGTFAINAAGAWTYAASSAHDEFVAGQHYDEDFDVVSADGTHTSVHLDILGTNDAPALDLNSGTSGTSTSINYTAGSVATALAPSATVTDIDSTDFNGGSLRIAVTANGTSADQLTIQNQGAGAGQIGVSGSNVTYGGTTIGTFAGGTNGTPLVVTFNANATQAATAALVGHILYSNATSATIAKTVTYTLVDGDSTANNGTDTATTTATINVTGGDTTAPTVVISHDNNGAKQTITFTFSEAVSGFDINDIALVGATATAGTFIHVGIDGTGHDIYTLDVTKPVGGGAHTVQVLSSGTGISFWTDIAGNPGVGTPAFSLPAGTSGEPINLALTDPSHEGALITVTVKDVPSGWTIDGATHNADGSWTTQTNDLHGLTVTTPVNFTGAAVLDVQMTWINADGTLGTASIADNVEAYAPGSPIFAWSGDDVLTGSHGNDLFVFSQPIGADTVHNFDTAADQIDLIGYNGLADFADLQTHIADDANGNAVIALGDGQSITLDGVHSGALTASNFVFDQTPVVNNSGTMTIGDGALLPLSGILNNSGLISLDSTGGDTLLQVIQHGVTLQGGGQILLSDSAANMISGTGPDVTLVNVDNTISGAGQLGGGMLSIDNQGTIIATGSHALVIDTGGSVVTNSGTLEATGSGGLTVSGGLANSGMLWANGGDIVIHGQVTGDGDATIGNLSKLEFGGASSTDVTFGHDAAGMLQLDDSFDYSGRIGGITNDDRLDLGDILFGAGTTAVYQANQDGSGGTLTVSDGTHGAALHLVGNYDANAFKLADDGQGHTVVSYNPAEFTLTGIGNGAISSDFVV